MRGYFSAIAVAVIASISVALCNTGYTQGASPNFPTLASGVGKQISIQAADKILRARAPKPRPTALRSAKVPKAKKISTRSRKGARNFSGLAPVACSGTGQPVEIATLAASLKCDPDLIFEYVYNNIEYEPLFGSNKGALGTLLDQRGSDLDQAQLFTALLSAAGVSSANFNFIFGVVHLTGAQASSWLGVKNDGAAILQLIRNGGIPINTSSINTDGTLASIDLGQVWVRVNIGGTNYDFDPSFKLHTVTTGLANLGTVLGYSQSQFLSDAGGTIDSVGISSINRAAVRSDLTKYANNLVSYIKANNPAWSVGDIVGGKSIQYLTGSPLRNTSLPILSPSQPTGFPQNWGSSVPNAFRTCFTISMPGVANQNCASATVHNILLYSDQTYGHRITVFSTGGSCAPLSGSCTPTLLIDGAAPPNGDNTGTAQNYGDTAHPWTVNVSITHPYGAFTAPNQTKTLSIVAGGSYLIGAGWGQVGRGMVEKHRTLLAQALAAGGSSSSEGVLGESLAVISYTYLAEWADQQRLGDATAQMTTQFHHGVGIAGQTSVQLSGNQGPYVDLPLNVVTLQPQTSYTGSGIAPSILSTFYTIAGVGSSLESAVLEQTQGLVPGIQAASTVRLVDTNAGTGAKTFFADGTTSGGVSTYFSSIHSSLTGYSPTDLHNLDCAVSQSCASGGSPTGNQILIPINGSIAIGTAPWTGWGYTITASNSAVPSWSITQQISGGLSGGYSGNNIPPTTVVSSTQSLTIPPSVTPTISAGASAQPFSLGNPVTTEPVDSITGAYLYNHSDLITGGGSFPYALPFSRSYSSAANTVDNGFGKGWRHNYDVTVSRLSDPFASLGESSSINAAAAIVGIYVTQDLLTGALSAQHETLAWMVDRWLTDQLTNNAVQVSWPATSEEFIILPHNDGSSTATYNAPMGSAATVTGTVPDTYGNLTTFTYRNKDQSQLTFNALNSALVGQLASWTMPYGVNLGFAYTSIGVNTYLTGVTNNLGRTLTVRYSGSHITSVTNDTGSSVSYGYDGNNNLTSFRDPLTFQTNFTYDGSASHLTQIFYPSNPFNPFVTNSYDGLGRVSQQANANGKATNFYLAGARSEIVDPASDRHITYQTARGSVLKDDAVLSGSANVYNDTAQTNGVVNVTANQYDGLARVVLTTAPEGGATAYVYSTDLLNNVVSTTRTAKPGSPLTPLTTNYGYDPIYSKTTSVTDPLGLKSMSGYDPATGNLLAATADYGSSHFNATSRFTYNSVGQVLTATDPLGVVTQFAYDGFGNQTSITRDAGTGHLNQLTTMTYNAIGDVVSVTDPKGNLTSNAYDADRRLVSTTTPSAPSAPGGLVTAFNYDPDGHLLQTQQSLSGAVLRATSSTYTLTGEIATSSDAKGNVTKYGYDIVDRLATVTDPVSNLTTYGYDTLSRQISVTNAAVQVAPLLQKSYTPDGLLATLTDANSHMTSFGYDGLDRLSTTTYPDSPSDKETLTYDADSNIVSRVTRKGDTISFAYDTLNRLCTKATATTPTACSASSANPTVFYSYDLAGHSIAVNDNSASIAVPSGAGASYTTSATYDALNNPISTSWTPAAAQATPTASSVSFTHGYDANNRRISQASNDNSWLNYPTTAGTTSYTPNTLNQYSAVGAVTPTYDGNGNLTFDGTYIYCYDAESRITKVLSSGTCASPGTTVASYAYDGQGRRKSKTVGSTTTLFVTDASNREVLEYNGSGAVQNWYAYGQGSNEVLNQMNVAGSARTTLIPDIQGSIVGALSSGGTLTKIGYRTYGENPSLTIGMFNYTAQRFDAETAGSAAQPSGLYYYRARMYSPTWGRFLQPDSIGYSAGANLYAYVGNDPLNLTDPSGRFAGVDDAAELAAIGGALVVAAGCQASGLCPRTAAAIYGAASRAWNAAGAFFNKPAPPLVPPSVGPGPYAGDSVPAGPSPRPTVGQQGKINDVGNTTGCHTCGTTDPGTSSGNWVGDHQPPTALNPEGAPQVYYPQCLSCSNTQGGLVRGLTRFDTPTDLTSVTTGSSNALDFSSQSATLPAK